MYLKTENFLKHKIRSRPERAELVRMHILQGEKKKSHSQLHWCFLFPVKLYQELHTKLNIQTDTMICMWNFPETGAEPSLQATQMRLKRARLADNLNEKIAQRPGPMELVEKNIIPVDVSLKEAIIGERTTGKKSLQKCSRTVGGPKLCFFC